MSQYFYRWIPANQFLRTQKNWKLTMKNPLCHQHTRNKPYKNHTSLFLPFSRRSIKWFLTWHQFGVIWFLIDHKFVWPPLARRCPCFKHQLAITMKSKPITPDTMKSWNPVWVTQQRRATADYIKKVAVEKFLCMFARSEVDWFLISGSVSAVICWT